MINTNSKKSETASRTNPATSDNLELTVRVRLGKTGARDYRVIHDVLQALAQHIEGFYAEAVRSHLPVPEFKQEGRDVYRYSLFEPPATIGGWMIAPEGAKVSERLFTAFPWLAEGDETPVSGADVIEELTRLYRRFVKEGR